MTIGQKLVRLALVVGFAATTAARAAAQGGEGPPAEPVNLVTKDGVQLKAPTSQAAARKGSHASETNDARRPVARLQGLANRLQPTRGKAANSLPSQESTVRISLPSPSILRAHGESIKQMLPAWRRG